VTRTVNRPLCCHFSHLFITLFDSFYFFSLSLYFIFSFLGRGKKFEKGVYTKHCKGGSESVYEYIYRGNAEILYVQVTAINDGLELGRLK
jgi:hypothetical protein